MIITALLPMKGNSERVPNKNMKLFSGAPLYHAIADKLLRSQYVNLIVINTDSEVISDDAVKTYGDRIRIINRPQEIRGDFVSMNRVIEHDLSLLDGEHFIQTHSTNPLLKTSTIDEAIEFYFDRLNTDSDSVFSVTKMQARLYDNTGKPINHDPNELRRTQDLVPLYEENSNFYLFSKGSFRQAGNKRIGLKPAIFPVKKMESVDIDEHDDFILAELIYKNMALKD